MRQGYCYTCLVIGGGYFGRVTKVCAILQGPQIVLWDNMRPSVALAGAL